MSEDACVFGQARSLVGIITDPPGPRTPAQLPAVIILDSGIVHRVGVNRLHVKLARKLAALGFVAMRFDFSGIGDSLAREDNLPFRKSTLDEMQQAMNHLNRTRGSDRFILIGICSGAGIALQTACIDARVVGVVPINCRGYLSGSNSGSNTDIRNRALLRHYWRIAFSSSFRFRNWLKAITGEVNYRSLVGAIGSQFKTLCSLPRNRSAAGVEHPFKSDLRSLLERGARLLFIHAEGDEGLDFVQMVVGDEVKDWSKAKAFELEVIPGANHTFALLWSQEKLVQLVCDWARDKNIAANFLR
jgi:alpha/beta superfamily hydrolase